jgi:hypothetical protein
MAGRGAQIPGTSSLWQLNIVQCTGVPRGVVWGVQTPPKFRSFEKAGPNSQFCGIYICNNLIRIWVCSFTNWLKPLTRGVLPPDPRSLCPLSSAEFVGTPPEKKFLGMLLVQWCLVFMGSQYRTFWGGTQIFRKCLQLCPCMLWRHAGRKYTYTHSYPNTRWRWVFSLMPQLLYPQERAPQYPMAAEHFRENFLPPLDLNSGSSSP